MKKMGFRSGFLAGIVLSAVVVGVSAFSGTVSIPAAESIKTRVQAATEYMELAERESELLEYEAKY